MSILRKLPPYFFTYIVVLAVLLLTCLPVPELVRELPTFFNADKLAHAIMFGGVTGAMTFDCARRSCLDRKHVVAALALGVALGAITEIVQATAPINRSGDWYDFTADCIGALTAYLTAPALCRRIFRNV